MLGNKLLNIQFAKYHIWNNKSEGFPNMVLSTETFNQSVHTEYSEAVNARYMFQPLWVSGTTEYIYLVNLLGFLKASVSFKQVSLKIGTEFRCCGTIIALKSYYCAFHKHANSEVQKPPSQLRFSQPFRKL